MEPGSGPPPIIGAEDDDFAQEMEPVPKDPDVLFRSVAALRMRPVPLLAFLHHVVTQLDPAPLLCSLHSELLLGLSPKERRKQFLEFWHLFLEEGALLQVPIPPQLQPDLERLRPEALPEEQQRRLLRELRGGQEEELERELRHFRTKRLLGMTPGEAELAALDSLPLDPGLRMQRERDLAEAMLERLEDVHLSISSDEEKSSAIFGAIVAYMKHLGVRAKGSEGKKSRSHFFRKKHSGSKRPEEPQGRARRGFLLAGGALWGRDPHYPEGRQGKGSESEGDKGPPQDKRGLKGAERPEPGGGPRARGGAAPPEPPPNLSPPPGDGPKGDTGLDPQEPGAPAPPPIEQPPEEGAGKESPDAGGDPPPPPTPPAPPPPPEAEPEAEPWRDLVPPPVLQGLSKSERRRQEGINELLQTERAHVRVLRVLLELFYGPALRGGFFPAPTLHNIFPGLEDLLEAHALFLDSLIRRQEESGFVIGAIGDLLLARFEGAEGRWFQKISARFCSRQPFALEQLKAKQRKDARFNHLIQEAESHPRCRRLQLRDIIPSEMQRLTKYPLLLQSISACTEDPEDRARVEKAAECCRRILDHVNREVRDMENFMKLKDYQRRLDLSGLKQSSDPLLSEFKGTDLTKRTLVHEGPLSWRLSRDKAVEVQVLLLDDLLVLLQRQDERFLLRCHGRNQAPAPAGKRPLSPVIRLRAAMTRLVATDPKAFYVIISWDNGAQIYELGAQTVAERKNWCDLINETAGALPLPAPPPGKGGRGGRPTPTPLEEAENGGGAKETLDEVPVLGTAPPMPGEGGLAAAALQRVAALKRLLPSPPLPPPAPPRDETEAPDGGGAGVTEPPPHAAGVGEELRGLEEALLRLKEMEESFWQLQQSLGKRGPTGTGDT